MSDNVLNISAIEKMANENGPVGYIREELNTKSKDDRYVEQAIRERIQQVEASNAGKSVSRKITDETLMYYCWEYEKLNVARIAFNTMIPNFKRVGSKRVSSLRKAHSKCLKHIEDIKSRITMLSKTFGTPEYTDTWNRVIRLDRQLLDGYLNLTRFALSLADLPSEHLRYISNGTHPVFEEIENDFGIGPAQFLEDLGIMLLNHPDVGQFLNRIWSDSVVAENILNDPVFARELKYFSRLRQLYGPDGKFVNIKCEN